MALETFQLRGKNYDDVVRQLVTTYNVSNGWAVLRVINRLTSLDVILERNSEQVEETQKETSTDTSTGTTQPLEAKEIVGEASTSEKPVAVKTTRKSQTRG